MNNIIFNSEEFLMLQSNPNYNRLLNVPLLYLWRNQILEEIREFSEIKKFDKDRDTSGTCTKFAIFFETNDFFISSSRIYVSNK